MRLGRVPLAPHPSYRNCLYVTEDLSPELWILLTAKRNLGFNHISPLFPCLIISSKNLKSRFDSDVLFSKFQMFFKNYLMSKLGSANLMQTSVLRHH